MAGCVKSSSGWTRQVRSCQNALRIIRLLEQSRILLLRTRGTPPFSLRPNGLTIRQHTGAMWCVT